MNENFIDYSTLVDNAMHQIVKKSLEVFAESDNHGEHHFFISFVTSYPGVVISEKLKTKYPHELTIVLQFMYEDLIINKDSFSVSLTFDYISENLHIPFAALTAFADPCVKFGLQFRQTEESRNSDGKKISTTVITNETAPEKTIDRNTNNDSNVITLDFRNKKRI